MTVPANETPEVSLVLPCYNEEECLAETAGVLLRAFARQGISLELVLVNNGSRDGTERVIDELARKNPAVVKVVVPVNQGYGHGILEGLKACRAPFLGYLCADGQVGADDVVRVYRLLQGSDGGVLTKVRRRFRQDSLKRKVISVCYNALMLALFGRLEAIDINGSPKIFSRKAYRRMQLRSKDWFLDPEIMIKAKHLKLLIAELNVRGLQRRGGKSNVRLSTCLEFLKNIARYRLGRSMARWKKSVKSLDASPPSPGEATPSPLGAISGNSRDLLSGVRVIEQRRFEDARGYLHKILAASQCAEGPPRGEVYVTTALPGQAKGNHLHRRMGEWFAVIQGEASVELCDPETGRRLSVPLGASHPRTVYVPPGLAHAVVNQGQDLAICVAWAEREHDPEDVFPYPVWPAGSPNQPSEPARR